MKFRHTAILLTAFAALLVYFLLVERQEEPDPSQRNEMMPRPVPLFDHLPDEVVEFVCTDGQKRTVLRRIGESSNWEVVEPGPPGPAQDDRVNFAVKWFSSLKAERVITDTEVLNNLADYGLQPPYAAGIMKLKDGRSFTLYVGDQTPDLTNRYTQLKGQEDQVLLVGILLPHYVIHFLEEPPFLPTPTPEPEPTPTAGDISAS